MQKSDMSNTLFTIGHSDRPIDDLIALLKLHNVTALCDVRSVPYSRRHPQFNREPLARFLRPHDIEYVYLGDELGARSKDPSCYVNGKASFQKIAATALFKNGLARIRLGREKNYALALMCAEKDPMHCHRSILICRNLRGQGFDIRHIIDFEKTETQAELERRLVAHLKLHPDIFEDAGPDSLIERAYDLQGDRMAYGKGDREGTEEERR